MVEQAAEGAHRLVVLVCVLGCLAGGGGGADAQYGGRSLREGIAAVLAERGGHEPDVEAFTALLLGALNEAALWVAEAKDSAAAGSAMRSSLRLLLNRMFGAA